MTLKEKIKSEIIIAMKAKNSVRLNALRNINAKILEMEKAPGSKEIVDNDIVKIATKLIDQRKTVIEEATKINRHDIIEKENAEKAIYEEFVPKSLSKEEITAEIKSIIDANDYAGMKDMKHVKSAFDTKYPGQEGKLVSEIAMSFLK
jgi:uncharacterized protein YqeY